MTGVQTCALPIYNNLDLDPDGRANIVERVKATLAEVIARAETIGCEIVIENIEDKDPRDRVRLAKALESSKVRVSLDTGHANYAHISTGAPPPSSSRWPPKR